MRRKNMAVENNMDDELDKVSAEEIQIIMICSCNYLK